MTDKNVYVTWFIVAGTLSTGNWDEIRKTGDMCETFYELR